MNTHQDFENYLKARKKVEIIKGFYFHLLSFLLVMLFLAYINLKYSPEHIWFLYPMLSWGIGLFFHAIKAFNWFPILGKDWEEKKIKEFMEKDRNQEPKTNNK